ncbi:MAG: cupin domain-containing protein [Pseudomonadota bacterium]
MSEPTFRMNPDPAGMTPSDFMLKDSFTTDDTTETNLFSYCAEDESVLSGVWEVAPTKEAYPDGYPVHEMMHVISGSVTMTHPDGRSETFKAGDTFYITKGAPCTWENTETMRKFYMIAT